MQGEELTVPGIAATPGEVAPPPPTPGIPLEPLGAAPAALAATRAPWDQYPRGHFVVHATFPGGEVEHAHVRGHQVWATAHAYADLRAGVTVEDLEA